MSDGGSALASDVVEQRPKENILTTVRPTVRIVAGKACILVEVCLHVGRTLGVRLVDDYGYP